jgi:hypothetical protein
MALSHCLLLPARLEHPPPQRPRYVLSHPALRSHGSAPDGLARRSGYLCSRSPESARHRPLILLFAQEESLHLSPCLQPD